MQVQVKYFAVLRELVGCAEELIPCPEGSDVAALLAILEARHEALVGQLGKVAIALDHYMSRYLCRKQAADGRLEGELTSIHFCYR